MIPMLSLDLRALPFGLTTSFFFFNDTATTEIYTLSLHDALPISSATSASKRAAGSRRSKTRRKTAPRSCRSEEHTSELQSPCNLVCRLLLEKKKKHLPNVQDMYPARQTVSVHCTTEICRYFSRIN